jgi:hypothetical protein
LASFLRKPKFPSVFFGKIFGLKNQASSTDKKNTNHTNFNTISNTDGTNWYDFKTSLSCQISAPQAGSVFKTHQSIFPSANFKMHSEKNPELLSKGRRRRRNPSSTQVLFYMEISSSSTVVVLALPLLYTFFLYISDLLQDHTPCTKTKLDINSWRMIVCLFYFFFFSSQIFKAIDQDFPTLLLSYEAAAAPLELKFLM